jgi:hypothetical protein
MKKYFFVLIALTITEVKKRYHFICKYSGLPATTKLTKKNDMKSPGLTIIFFLTALMLTAGEESIHRTISWQELQQVRINDSESLYRASFTGATYRRESGGVPWLAGSLPLQQGVTEITARIENAVYDAAPEGIDKIEHIEIVAAEPVITVEIGYDRKMPFANYSILPLRKNSYNGQYEVLVSFDIVVTTIAGAAPIRSESSFQSTSSVLANGTWYKISVDRTGIFQVTYTDLQQMGIDPASIDPRHIRIYGNGGGMLPESLNEFRHSDLVENNILVTGEGDGKFDPQDIILFYGESPHEWNYQIFSQAFQHEQNIYSDVTSYFLTTDLGSGKRIGTMPGTTEQPNAYVTKFTDYAYHEKDLHNLGNIGRVWFGEVFDVTTTYSFNFNFPDIDLTSPVNFRAYVAANSEVTTAYKFYNGNTEFMSASISGIPASATTEARPYIGSGWFSPVSEDLNIRISYEKVISSSLGWLNFFELNVIRNLNFSGSQMAFRDPASVAPGAIAEFTLKNAPQNIIIWNVTDPTNVRQMETLQSGNSQIFRIAHDSLAEFIAYNGSGFLPVAFVEKVSNQDLQGEGPRDMIIITHPMFREQADRLADFHTENDGLTVFVTEIDKVYNEFSSGVQDITAIRNFMKYQYDNAPAGQEPRYLLLFGDASFDYKDRISNNSNFVPTWEDDESFVIVYSIASDDYYGFLDGPGDNMLDIGIGRIPVQTVEQATVAVDKIIHYATNTSVVMKDWRNYLCFVADDEDGNLHLRQAEEMAAFIDTNYGVYNIDKIYVDAFPQVSTPGGQRSPEVNSAINNRIDKGCLVMNYTGHGGEVGWGHERFLENSDINSWTNYDRMPIFITATCEFSRYDDPERTSAGEYAYLNPAGGAIAMFTTARATFGGSNFNLNTALFDHMFEENNGEYYRFGDLIRLAKNDGGVDGNDKKFILLGDPALHLAYPKGDVITTRINDEEVTSLADTLQALKKIKIEGEVVRSTGGGASFNGTVFPIVFDKPSRITTLASDPTSYESNFEVQSNILYKGKAQVIDGKFSFTFIVPKDIAYNYGYGKISYYAANETEDAHGYYRNILVGGLDQSAEPDVTGPEVQLFINDEQFVFGGMTDENPDMFARVSDASGINTVGTGIGHDIVAILDGNSDKPIILNDFYESDLNSYTSGTIRYPFYNLSEGLHTLSLKVWDVFNNSADAYLEFFVIKSDGFIIDDVMNYPNPFITGTSFVFSQNQAEGELDVNIRIFNLSGQIVRTIETKLNLTGYRTQPIPWDGSDDSGGALSKGMYLYRIIARNENGMTDDKTGKLILIR